MTLDIQTAEIIAPKDSHRMDSYRPEKTYDFPPVAPQKRLMRS